MVKCCSAEEKHQVFDLTCGSSCPARIGTDVSPQLEPAVRTAEIPVACEILRIRVVRMLLTPTQADPRPTPEQAGFAGPLVTITYICRRDPDCLQPGSGGV